MTHGTYYVTFWKVPRLLSFVILARATCWRRWVWSIDGMVRTGETEVLGGKLVSAPLCPPHISRGQIWNWAWGAIHEVQLNRPIIQNFSYYLTENALRFHYDCVMQFRKMTALTLHGQSSEQFNVKSRYRWNYILQRIGPKNISDFQPISHVEISTSVQWHFSAPAEAVSPGRRGVYRIKSVIVYASVVTRKKPMLKIIGVNFFSNLHTSISLSSIGVTSWTLRMKRQILFSPFIKIPCNHLHVLIIYCPYYFWTSDTP
jgi:hypothetical protein